MGVVFAVISDIFYRDQNGGPSFSRCDSNIIPRSYTCKINTQPCKLFLGFYCIISLLVCSRSFCCSFDCWHRFISNTGRCAGCSNPSIIQNRALCVDTFIEGITAPKQCILSEFIQQKFRHEYLPWGLSFGCAFSAGSLRFITLVDAINIGFKLLSWKFLIHYLFYAINSEFEYYLGALYVACDDWASPHPLRLVLGDFICLYATDWFVAITIRIPPNRTRVYGLIISSHLWPLNQLQQTSLR